MKIEVLNNIEAKLPIYIVSLCQEQKQFDLEVVENISVFEYNTSENKYYVEYLGNVEEDYIYEGEFSEDNEYFEGSKKQMIVNAYERNKKVRLACIKKYGAICSACNMDFNSIYGERGNGFIEVHHLISLHKIAKKYQLTVDDLRPICSNCHSMIHRYRDDMTIECLKKIIQANRGAGSRR